MLDLFRVPLVSDIFSDNQASIYWCTEANVKHQATKHIDIRYKYVRELVTDGVINLKWIATKMMVADILTKHLPNTTFVFLRNLFFNVGTPEQHVPTPVQY
jgi:hypothetical protein